MHRPLDHAVASAVPTDGARLAGGRVEPLQASDLDVHRIHLPPGCRNRAAVPISEIPDPAIKIRISTAQRCFTRKVPSPGPAFGRITRAGLRVRGHPVPLGATGGPSAG